MICLHDELHDELFASGSPGATLVHLGRFQHVDQMAQLGHLGLQRLVLLLKRRVLGLAVECLLEATAVLDGARADKAGVGAVDGELAGGVLERAKDELGVGTGHLDDGTILCLWRGRWRTETYIIKAKAAARRFKLECNCAPE